MKVPMTNAMISSAANATAARIFPRHGWSSGGTYAGAVLMFSSGGGTACDWSQLQNGHERACASIGRPHRIHGFRSVIAVKTLQPAYRVVPNVQPAGSGCKSFRRNVFRNDRAVRLREPIQSAAARVVGPGARTADDDAIDTGRKLRCVSAVK